MPRNNKTMTFTTGDLTFSLTAREREILAKFDEGLVAREIGNLLFISKRTVDFHVANAYDAMGVRNRTQALNMARAVGAIGARSC